MSAMAAASAVRSCGSELAHKREDAKTVSKTRTKRSRSRAGKVAMALVFASAVGGMFITPASGQHYDNTPASGQHHDNAPPSGQYYDNHGGYYEQGRYVQGRYVHGRYVYGRPVHQTPPPRYYYPAPVYTPPPVVYTPAPYQTPGISLFFPFIIR
jgi:hypothetical protein